MRTVFILALLTAAAWAGWHYWYKAAPAPTTLAAAGAATPTAGGGASATAPSSAPALANAPAPVNPATTDPPAAVKPLLEAAEGAWSAAGADPQFSPGATTLLKQFSDVLKGLYNQPSARALEEHVVQDRLKPLADALFFSRSKVVADPIGLFAVHAVMPGENPDAIARKYGMSRELLNRLRSRDVNDSSLKAGEQLKVVKIKEAGGFFLHIDKSDYLMDVYAGPLFVRRYIITHGAKESPTPVGKTKLTDRVWHPQWTHPDTNQVLTFGDPNNILGEAWLPFDADLLGRSGIGIHGYTGSDGVMQAQQSHGCIRMENPSIVELYQTLSPPDRAPTAAEIVE